MDRTTNIIERAFQLAEECAGIEQLRTRLKEEGYSQVDAHLSGGKIRADLAKIFRRNA